VLVENFARVKATKNIEEERSKVKERMTKVRSGYVTQINDVKGISKL
jgi:hypothetical protein